MEKAKKEGEKAAGEWGKKEEKEEKKHQNQLGKLIVKHHPFENKGPLG
jgi:hypothetical protein